MDPAELSALRRCMVPDCTSTVTNSSTDNDYILRAVSNHKTDKDIENCVFGTIPSVFADQIAVNLIGSSQFNWNLICSRSSQLW